MFVGGGFGFVYGIETVSYALTSIVSWVFW